MWSEFVNLTAVVMTLLELQTDPLVPIEIKKAIAQSGNIPGTGKFVCLFVCSLVVLSQHEYISFIICTPYILTYGHE